MAFPKYKLPPSPKNKIIKQTKIINGKTRYAETFNGKVVRVFDDDGNVIEDRSASFGDKLPPLPEVRPRPKIEKENISIKQDKSSEEKTKEETPKSLDNLTASSQTSISGTGSGLQLISGEEVAGRGDIIPKENSQSSQCPECKGANIEPILYLDNSTRYRCKDCNETFAKDKYIDKTEITTSKIEEATKAEITTSKIEDATKAEITTSKIEDATKAEIIAPKIELTIPKIDIHKSEPPKEILKEAPKEVKEVPVPGINISIMDRLSKIMEEKPVNKPVINEKSSNITKVESPKAEIQKEIPKEAPKIEQSKIKKPKEVKRFMAEEDQEIMEERKFEQWLKKNRFNESVNKMAELAEKNQEQIENISGDMTGVKKELGDVENRIDNLKDGLHSVLGATKKPITETLGELCTGVDCIKEDVKKYQDVQSELDKRMDQRFSELRERIQKIEEPTFVCDSCGQDGIKVLSSFCPNCGSPIHSWYDDTGQPVKGWVPYWKRIGKQST